MNFFYDHRARFDDCRYQLLCETYNHQTWPYGYKKIFMINSAEHEIFPVQFPVQLLCEISMN